MVATGPMMFGKLPAKNDYRTLLFENYVLPTLPPPPPAFSALTEVVRNLPGRSIPQLFPMFANDRMGNCVVAGAAHGTTLFRAMIDQQVIPAEQTVIDTYWQLSGGQDTGLYPLDFLKWWRKNGLVAGSTILAFVKVNPRDHIQAMQAAKLFGGVFTGFQVQEACQRDFAARRPWTPGRLTESGHLVWMPGYTPRGGDDILTWGRDQSWTWEWWDACVDEAYVVLPEEAKDPSFAPGFDVYQLQVDLAALVGEPPPPPPPLPVPVPPPVGPLVIGEGVRREITRLGFTPIGDETYFANQNGTAWSQTPTTGGIFIASNATGEWRVVNP